MKGAIIAAVDLVQGIGVCAGMDVLKVKALLEISIPITAEKQKLALKD